MQHLRDFVKRPTSINIIINTGGSVLNVLFGALIHFILFRMMSPVDYGILTIWLSLVYVFSAMLDFGTTATIYGYLPPLLSTKKQELYDFLKSLLTYQTVLGVLSALVLLFTFPVIDTHFLKTNAPYSLVVATVAAILLFIVQNFTINLLYASKDFVRANLYINVANLVKILLLLSLVPLGRIDTTTIFSTITLGGVIAFFVPVIITRGHILMRLWKATLNRKTIRLRYTFTYLLSTQIFNLGQRMDLFLLSYFGLGADAGYYAAAQKILLSIASAIISVTQVLSPQFSHIKNRQALKTLTKQSLLYLSLPAGIFLLLIVTPQSLFSLYLEKFDRASVLARQLAPAYVIYSFANFPLLFLLYTVKKPGAILLANTAFFLSMTIGCYLLIPAQGLSAIPAVVTGSITLAALILCIYTAYEYTKFKN